MSEASDQSIPGPTQWVKRRRWSGVVFAGLLLAGLVAMGVAASRLAAPVKSDAFARSTALATLTDIGDSLRHDIARVVHPAIERTKKLALNAAVIEALRTGKPESGTEACNLGVLESTEIDALAIFDRAGQILAINTVYASGEAIEPERVKRILALSFEGRDIIQSCVKNAGDTEVLEFQTTCDITPAFFDSTGLSVAYSVPVFDPATKEKIGVASARLRFERLLDLIEKRSVGGANGGVNFVTDKGGYFSEEINSGRAKAPVPEGELEPIVRALALGGVDQYMARHGSTHLSLFRLKDFETLDGGGIQVLLQVNEEWITSEVRQARAAEAGIFGVIGLMLILLGVMVRSGAKLKESEAITREAMAIADQASRAKSEFIANMSHEIRTPMTAIVGFAELLMDPTLSPEQRTNAVQTIRGNGDHLLSIINDILDLSKIEAGKMTVEQVPCPPSGICEEVFSLMQVRAIGKGVKLRIEYDPAISVVLSDPLRLRQVLTNLVGNAIKFTERGEVVLRAACVPMPEIGSEGPMMSLRFSVTDSGIGMTPEQMQRLFKPYSQADSSTSRKFGGTGLGLLISRKLTAALGGELSVTSEAGRGSEFVVDLRVPAATADQMKSAASVSTDGSSGVTTVEGRVLLAEDGPDNQRLIMFHLKKAGADVVLAENGRIAVEAAIESAKEGRPVGLILMDMQMPELDGYAATSLLRAKGWTGPIVALTAHAMSGDRQRCINAGCDDYLTKPIDRQRLIETCARWMSCNRPSIERAA